MSKILTLSEVKARLSELVATIERTEEELIITRNGRPAAVIISAEEFDSWKETLAIQRNPALMQEIKQGLAQLEKGTPSLLRKSLENHFILRKKRNETVSSGVGRGRS